MKTEAAAQRRPELKIKEAAPHTVYCRFTHAQYDAILAAAREHDCKLTDAIRAIVDYYIAQGGGREEDHTSP